MASRVVPQPEGRLPGATAVCHCFAEAVPVRIALHCLPSGSAVAHRDEACGFGERDRRSRLYGEVGWNAATVPSRKRTSPARFCPSLRNASTRTHQQTFRRKPS